jgi:hypothetical protein
LYPDFPNRPDHYKIRDRQNKQTEQVFSNGLKNPGLRHRVARRAPGQAFSVGEKTFGFKREGEI